MTRPTLAATALAAAVLAQPALAQEKVAIGFPPAIDFLPAMVAEEIGCYAEQGIDAELTVIPIATNIAPALMSGSLQIGMSTATILLPAVENGLPLVAVAGSSRMVPGADGISVIMAADKAVSGAEELKGKKIGVPGIMSVGDLIFRQWLTDKGLAESDVTYIEAPFPRMMEMVKSGAVDGVLAAEPIRSAFVGSGIGAAPVQYFAETTGDTILTFWVSTTDWAEANPELVAGFRTCLDAAAAHIGENRAEAEATMEKYLGYRTDKSSAWTSELAPADFEVYARIAKTFGLIREEVDTGSLVAD